jgi:uncharacterized protein YeaO (DUF488 family)
LAGFTKKDDLEYFLDVICNIKYIHDPLLSPTKSILDAYKKKEISWIEYETKFNELLASRNIYKKYNSDLLNNACLLCSESEPEFCHRRLVAEYFKMNNNNINIIHL